MGGGAQDREGTPGWKCRKGRACRNDRDQHGRHDARGSDFQAVRPHAGSLPRPAPTAASARRLSYRERREWEEMEGRILAAEESLADEQRAVADPVVATDAEALAERWQRLEAARAEVELLYARWAELESKLDREIG